MCCFRLVNWCSDYCKNHHGDSNPKAHKVFYAGCQVCSVELPELKSNCCQCFLVSHGFRKGLRMLLSEESFRILGEQNDNGALII